jgi:hypothetical protein
MTIVDRRSTIPITANGTTMATLDDIYTLLGQVNGITLLRMENKEDVMGQKQLDAIIAAQQLLNDVNATLKSNEARLIAIEEWLHIPPPNHR